MNYLKLLPVLLLALVLAACGQEEEGAEDSTEQAAQKTEEVAEDMGERAEEAWEETREAAQEAMEGARESDAWEETKEGAREAWAATKEYSKEAWDKVRESFIGDMTAEEKQAFDDCVATLQKEEGLTEDQAERGCWKMSREGTLAAYLSGGGESESETEERPAEAEEGGEG